MKTYFFALGLVLTATPAWAQPELTLDDVARLALERQPNLDAYTKASTAANEAAIAEGQLPDPQLTFGVQNLPVTGDAAYRLDREDMTMVTVGVMQEIVRKPIRTAAANRMRAESAQWQAQRGAEARRVVRDATGAAGKTAASPDPHDRPDAGHTSPPSSNSAGVWPARARPRSA